MHDDYWNQWPGVILGAEDDDAANDSNNGEDSDSDDDDDDSNDEGQGNDGGNTPSADDLAALQRALQAERRNNKRLTRENNRFKASQDRQNALLTTVMSQQTDTILNRVNPRPIPAYQVANPNVGVNCCGCC